MIGEYLALLMIAILTLFFYEKNRVITDQMKIYGVCLGLSAVSIILNICCVEILSIGSDAPYWLLLLLNTTYFLACVWTCSFMAWYIFYKILEHVYDRHCMQRAMTVLAVLNLLFLLLMLLNLKYGWVFQIDATGGYQRGVFNAAGYGVLLLEVLTGIICYVKNSASVNRQVAKAIKTIVSMVLFLMVIQRLFPDVMINGILMSFTSMIFLIHFQSQKTGIDAVTGLGNRTRFLEEVSLRLGGEQKFQILLLTLKDFNLINRKYGYAWGDNLLYHVGDNLEGWEHQSSVFRFSNVTFAVFCPYLNEEQARQNFTGLKARFMEEWVIGGETLRLSVRFTELIHREESWKPFQIMDYLEYLLHYGKEQEQDEVSFNEELERQFQKNAYLTQAMRTAIERENFQVWYQPIYCVAEGCFTSAEALVRMFTIGGEWIPPSDFIPLAEAAGMVEAINWIVLEKVCCFLGRNKAIPIRSISVNMTSNQIVEPDFLTRLERLLAIHQLPKDKLRIEITERVMAKDSRALNKKMCQMWEEGYRFYLDDFGIGYSNFYSVMHLPFECVKLDKSLIDDLSIDQANAKMVQEITKVFHDIGQLVVAEGIETEKQSKLAASLGVDRIQGYHYAKPLPEKEFLAFICDQQAESGYNK